MVDFTTKTKVISLTDRTRVVKDIVKEGWPRHWSSTDHQGNRGKRGVLQRQPGIGGNTLVEERRDEQLLNQQFEGIKSEMKIERKIELSDKVPELIVPDTMVLSGGAVTMTNTQPTLLQVPAMVMGPRDPQGPCPLPKQHSNPTPLLAPTPIISKQTSHPELRGPPKHQGPPPMMKQQSYPSVLTHAPSHSIERIPNTTSSNSSTSGQQQHLQVIPMQLIMKQRPLSTPTPSVSSQLRPIQPKPSSESELPNKKDIPLIRLTPSEESVSVNLSGGYGIGGCGPTGPPRLPRAVSEEPAMTRPSITHTPELLAPGPSALVQSISQDSGLDGGALRLGRMPMGPQVAATAPSPIRQASTPGHCPVLRGGPALGCNFCWNSTDPQGRVLRRKTKYHCPECRTNLCIVPCFHEYHKQIERAQDTDKQITKILTKTSSM